MDKENEYAPEDVVEQEDQTSEDTEETQEEETVTLSKSEFKKLQRQAIAYNANKTSKKETQTTSNVSEIDIEAKILKSQGIDDDMIEEMKTLATLRGKSLLEMKSDPIIVAMNQEKERQEKERQARLGASKGSGTVKQEVTTQTPGLSEDEHKRLWKELNNK